MARPEETQMQIKRQSALLGILLKRQQTPEIQARIERVKKQIAEMRN